LGIPNKIKAIRETRGITQAELAISTKRFNQSQICKIEKGNRRITDRDLVIIAEALGVKVADLIEEFNQREL